MLRVTARWVGACALLGTLSCAESTTAPLPPSRPTAVAVTPATIQLDALGATARLSAEVKDQRGWVMSDATVTWSSADASVAQVDDGGLVTAVGYGESIITAASGSASGSATVTVAAVPPEPVGSIPDQAVEAGRDVMIDASAYFRDPNGDALAYTATSSDEGVARAVAVGSDVTVAGIGPGTATVTVTASDPGGLSATQVFGVVVSGSVEDDFDSPASLNDWETGNAEAAVVEGALNLTNRTEGRLGIAERRDTPAVTEWTIQARMGRTTRRASPGVVSLTRHGRFTAVRLVLRTLDDDDRDRDRRRDRAADETAAMARNYEFAAFDGAAGEWVLVTNLSGGSESVLEEPGEFTEIALGHEGGDFVGRASAAGEVQELFRFDLATSRLDGIALGEIVSDATGLWLVNQAEPGLTAQHDRVRITGTGSDATPPDPAVIADAPDEPTRSVALSGPDAQRATLVALYRATGGPNWKNSGNWLTDAPLGDWYGVDTDAFGRVTTIDLATNRLTGGIPPELGRLEGLRWIDFYDNGLTGGIPRELGGLANLESLRLRDNGLTGGIPPELGRLESLRWLDLSDNGLTGGIPRELGGLANLANLRLRDNGLTGGIPSELGRLESLRWLNLSDNDLTGGIPPDLSRLSNLEFLWLGDNALTGPIPPALSGLSNLSVLELRTNHLTGGIPSEIGDLASLRELDLYNNNLNGEIPPEIGRLANLQYLNLGVNELSGTIPPELGTLAHLRLLWLNHNSLTGGIPAELGNLGSIRELVLDHNDLAGGIPLELGNLANLEALFLNSNDLVGGIPPQLGNLVNLERLDLSLNNDLTGEIPSELGDLASLRELRLHSNKLTGQLPESLLQLSLNRFSWYNNAGLCAPSTPAFRAWLAMIAEHRPGSFCSDAADRAALVALYEATDGPNWRNSENWLTDAPLADWYGVNTNGSGRVVSLDLSGEWDQERGESTPHGLSGPIPPELGTLVALQALNLSSNELTGAIPPELGNLVSLEWLELGVNSLTGSIPPELGNLRNVRSFNVSANDLSGELPPELGKLTNVRNLAGNTNNLTGQIPAELGNLTNLQILQFWDNDLTGEIPPELGSLPNHVSIYLSGNSLSGSIPPELGNVQLLSLGGNELSGTIPRELGDIGIVEWLLIYHNNLEGQLPDSFLKLSLRRFSWNGNEGLCAPDTAAFRTWLATIEQHSPGPYCSGSRESIGRRRSGSELGGFGPGAGDPFGPPRNAYGIDFDDGMGIVRLPQRKTNPTTPPGRENPS